MNPFKISKKQNSGIYPAIAKAYGGWRRRNKENYSGIVREAMNANFVVDRCLREIYKSICNLNFKVSRRTSKGLEVLENHPVQLFFENPNSEYSREEFIKRSIFFQYIAGDSPYEINISGNKIAAYVYRPDRITFANTGDVEQPYKDIKYEGFVGRTIDPSEFAIWKNFDLLDEQDGLGHGVSRLKPLFASIDQHSALKQWNLGLLENGGNPSYMVTMTSDAPMDQVSYDRAKASLEERQKGARNAGNILFLPGKFMASPLGTNAKDMDWLNGEKELIRQLCSGLGVDPIIIGYNDYSTYNNKQEASKELYTKTSIPVAREMLKVFESYFKNKGTLKPDEYITIDTSNVMELQKNKKEVAELQEKRKHWTINEKRAEDGKEPVPGGDQIYVPMSEVPIGESRQSEGEKSDFYY